MQSPRPSAPKGNVPPAWPVVSTCGPLQSGGQARARLCVWVRCHAAVGASVGRRSVAASPAASHRRRAARSARGRVPCGLAASEPPRKRPGGLLSAPLYDRLHLRVTFAEAHLPCHQ
jgi:hypothetical protein